MRNGERYSHCSAGPKRSTTLLKKSRLDLRKNEGAFTCGFCGKRHPYSQYGQYHTKETAELNNAPKWRYPK